MPISDVIAIDDSIDESVDPDDEKPPIYIFDSISDFSTGIESNNGEEVVYINLIDEGKPIATSCYSIGRQGIIVGPHQTQVAENFRGRGIATQLFTLRTELSIRRWREKTHRPNQYPDRILVNAIDDDRNAEAKAEDIAEWLRKEFLFTREPSVEQVIGNDYKYESKNKADTSFHVALYKRFIETISHFACENVPEDLIVELYNRIYDDEEDIPF